MRYLIIIVIVIFTFGCKTQRNEIIAVPTSDFKPPFRNQGEQENYWAQEVFKSNYKKLKYDKYSGKIENIDNEIFIYGNKSFNLYGVNNTLVRIFSKGILYPQLISGHNSEPRKTKQELDPLSTSEHLIYEYMRSDDLTITNLEELGYLSNSPKVKRFRLWLGGPKSANPQVYLFELTNINADKKTDLKEFIESSQLTFLKEGWIII